MRTFFAWLIPVFCLSEAAWAANPLTRAEKTVCRNMGHCLSIVKTHPHDSFDYDVLSQEFERFGAKGRKALVRLLKNDGAEAGQAADLIAQSQDARYLPLLDAIPDAPLVARTRDALDRRLGVLAPPPPAPRPKIDWNTGPSPCPRGETVDPRAQAREMPFFEAAVARPDAYGAYRPSAEIRLALNHSDRVDLRAAVPVPGGWIAGYAGGLVHYDGRTGQPTRLSRASIVSVQRADMTALKNAAWVITADITETTLLWARADAAKRVATMPGRPSHLQRLNDGTLILSLADGRTVQLGADGQLTEGCPV